MADPQARLRYAKRRAARECVACGELALPGKALCLFHRDQFGSATRALRARRKAAGDCQECGAPASGKVHCPRCAKHRSAEKIRRGEWARRGPERARKATLRRIAGQCSACPALRDRDDRTKCADCRASAARC